MGGGELTAFIALFGMVLASEAATTITVDSVVQRWPWNNKVDISYTIEGGQELATSNFCKIVFSTVIEGNSYTIDGSSVGASASAGTHKVTWTLPSGLKSANCTMTAAVYPADVPSGNDYMIIDLDTGAISYEGLFATQDESNSRYNTALYKTSKLALRKVPAGTYTTGDDDHFPSTLTGQEQYDRNSSKSWATDRDYYIGVFPVTQRQYSNVCGANPSSKKAAISGNIADHRPVETVSWFRLRVSATDDQVYYAPTSPVPAVTSNTGTFLQRLNFKTGKYFDLPTELMWEIAARANTTTYYYWGNTTNSILDYVSCSENNGGGTSTMEVGTRIPNGWGLYDLLGNVYQICLDDRTSDNLTARTSVFKPACVSSAAATGSDVRRLRNGLCYNIGIGNGRGGYSSYRGQIKLGTGTSTAGFRLSYVAE